MYRFSFLFLALVFTLALLPINVRAFDGGVFRLQGIILEVSNGEPVPGVAIVCQSTGEGVISNERGQFIIPISWSDSLIFSALTYENITVKPPDSLFQESFVYTVRLKASQHTLNELQVEGEDRLAIPLRSDVFKERPKASDFFFRPISVIYYYASKREQRKRFLIRMIEQEKLMEEYAHVYNREVIEDYSGLTDRELDYCVIYCNANIELKHGDTDEVVKWRIMNLISEFYKQKAQRIKTTEHTPTTGDTVIG